MPAACGAVHAFNKNTCRCVRYLEDLVQVDSQEDGQKAKKPRQGEEEDSKEGSDEEDEASEESDKESDKESQGRDEISMPKEGHQISKLKCVEIKGRGRVWRAFFCEVKCRQWCKLDAAPSEHALRKAVAACRRNPGKEQSLHKGSTDAGCAMPGSGTGGVACWSC